MCAARPAVLGELLSVAVFGWCILELVQAPAEQRHFLPCETGAGPNAQQPYQQPATAQQPFQQQQQWLGMKYSGLFTHLNPKSNPVFTVNQASQFSMIVLFCFLAGCEGSAQACQLPEYSRSRNTRALERRCIRNRLNYIGSQAPHCLRMNLLCTSVPYLTVYAVATLPLVKFRRLLSNSVRRV